MNVMEKVGAGLALVSMGIGSAMAEVPEGVTTALTEAKTDVGTIATAVLLVFVAIFGFKILKRAF